MGTLYENITSLCNERGIKGGKMCTDIGISKGLLTDLKMGRRTGVSAVTAQKIADYFGVSVAYLLGKETEKAPTDSGERKDVLDQFKKHVITSKVGMDGLRRCDEVLAQLQKKRKRAKKSWKGLELLLTMKNTRSTKKN